MSYSPLSVPSEEELSPFLQDELRKIENEFDFGLMRNVEFLSVAPLKPREGNVYGADGVSWNPGWGKGLYVYYDGEWNPMSGMAEPLEMYVQRTGLYRGQPAKIVNLIGFRTQWFSNLVLGDICNYLGAGQSVANTPVAGTIYYLNSTSVQDLTAGTGVDRVRIVYLDAAGAQQVMNASLNGTTAVSLGADISFIQWMESYHSTAADRVAAGALTISSINGVATEATTMAMISAAANRSESLHYRVPTGKVAYMIEFGVQTNGTSGTYRLRATLFSDDATMANAYHFQDVATLGDGSAVGESLYYRKLSAGVTLKASIIPKQIGAGSSISSMVHLLVVG